MKFVFFINIFDPDPARGPHASIPRTISRFAKTVELAYQAAASEIPEGARVWTWMAVPDEACTLCGGPFHPATGHWESDTRHWCGVCARDMYAMLKTFTPRRWGGLKFYHHAIAPTGDTSEADLAGEELKPLA